MPDVCTYIIHRGYWLGYRLSSRGWILNTNTEIHIILFCVYSIKIASRKFNKIHEKFQKVQRYYTILTMCRI